MDDVVTTEDFLNMSLQERCDLYFKIYQKLGELALITPDLHSSDIDKRPLADFRELALYSTATKMFENLMDLIDKTHEIAYDNIHTSL